MQTQKVTEINGQKMISLVNDDSKVAALVDLRALKVIVSNLKLSSLEDVTDRVKDDINNCATHDQLLEILDNEVTLMKTIKYVQESNPDKLEDQRKLQLKKTEEADSLAV